MTPMLTLDLFAVATLLLGNIRIRLQYGLNFTSPQNTNHTSVSLGPVCGANSDVTFIQCKDSRTAFAHAVVCFTAAYCRHGTAQRRTVR